MFLGKPKYNYILQKQRLLREGILDCENKFILNTGKCIFTGDPFGMLEKIIDIWGKTKTIKYIQKNKDFLIYLVHNYIYIHDCNNHMNLKKIKKRNIHGICLQNHIVAYVCFDVKKQKFKYCVYDIKTSKHHFTLYHDVKKNTKQKIEAGIDITIPINIIDNMFICTDEYNFCYVYNFIDKTLIKKIDVGEYAYIQKIFTNNTILAIQYVTKLAKLRVALFKHDTLTHVTNVTPTLDSRLNLKFTMSDHLCAFSTLSGIVEIFDFDQHSARKILSGPRNKTVTAIILKKTNLFIFYTEPIHPFYSFADIRAHEFKQQKLVTFDVTRKKDVYSCIYQGNASKKVLGGLFENTDVRRYIISFL